MNEEIIVKVGADISELGKKLDAANGEISGFGSKMGGIMKGVGMAAVAGVAVATTAFAGFSKSAITSAADAAAMNAQFSQVFGDLETDATASLSKVAKETGIFENRLKGAYTQMAAFAKTTGLETSKALELTERATLAAADSAAFYDKSIEEVTESLQSYLKGNFENDAALGISSTETTRNAKANELYGQSFKDLSEAQKQLTLLAMVEDGNKLSGALGQASREADGFANITGNLKQAWQDVLVQFGTPILPIVTKWIKAISSAIQNFDATPYINAFKMMWQNLDTFVSFVMDGYKSLKQTFSGGFISAETIAQFTSYLTTAWTVAQFYFNAIVEVVRYAFGLIKEYIIPLLSEIVAFIGEKLAVLKAFWQENGDQILQAVSNVWNAIKAVIDFVMPAIMWVVKSVWNNIKGVISGVLNVIMGLVKVFAGLLTGDFGKMWEGVKQIFSGAITAIWNAINLLFFAKILKGAKALFTGMKTAFAAGWTTLRTNTTNSVNAIKEFLTSGFRKMGTTVKETFTKLVTTVKTKWDEAKNFLKNINLTQIGKDIVNGLINGIKSKFNAVKDIVRNVAKLIPDTVAGILGIASPSKVFKQIGAWTGEGLAIGLDGEVSAVKRSAQELANASIAKPTLSYATPSGSYGSLSSAVNGEVAVSVGEQNGLLREIVTAIREGQVITLDGKAVGKRIDAHQERETQRQLRNANGGIG